MKLLSLAPKEYFSSLIIFSIGVFLIGALLQIERQPKKLTSLHSCENSLRLADCPEASDLRRYILGDSIRINRASANEIALLPGVGKRLAQRIILSRDEDGPFKQADDLTRVRGIGLKTAVRLDKYLSYK